MCLDEFNLLSALESTLSLHRDLVVLRGSLARAWGPMWELSHGFDLPWCVFHKGTYAGSSRMDGVIARCVRAEDADFVRQANFFARAEGSRVHELLALSQRCLLEREPVAIADLRAAAFLVAPTMPAAWASVGWWHDRQVSVPPDDERAWDSPIRSFLGRQLRTEYQLAELIRPVLAGPWVAVVPPAGSMNTVATVQTQTGTRVGLFARGDDAEFVALMRTLIPRLLAALAAAMDLADAVERAGESVVDADVLVTEMNRAADDPENMWNLLGVRDEAMGID